MQGEPSGFPLRVKSGHGLSLYKKVCAPRVLLHHAKKTPIGVFFVVEEDGFEPSKSLTTDLQSAPFGHSGIPPYSVAAAEVLELVDGLEPPTC